jgi:hypothetical protein
MYLLLIRPKYTCIHESFCILGKHFLLLLLRALCRQIALRLLFRDARRIPTTSHQATELKVRTGQRITKDLDALAVIDRLLVSFARDLNGTFFFFESSPEYRHSHSEKMRSLQ